MRKQAAKIEANVLTAAYLLTERNHFNTAVTISDSVYTSIGKVCVNYERFENEEVLSKLDENIRHISKAIDGLVKVQTRSVEHDDMLDLVFLEKTIAELEVARIICYEEKMHYIECKKVELGTLEAVRKEKE